MGLRPVFVGALSLGEFTYGQAVIHLFQVVSLPLRDLETIPARGRKSTPWILEFSIEIGYVRSNFVGVAITFRNHVQTVRTRFVGWVTP